MFTKLNEKSVHFLQAVAPLYNFSRSFEKCEENILLTQIYMAYTTRTVNIVYEEINIEIILYRKSNKIVRLLCCNKASLTASEKLTYLTK